MTNTTAQAYIDNLEDNIEEHDDEDDVMWMEDDWEATDFVESVERKFPGWHLVKIINFNGSTLDAIKQWTTENARYGQFKQVGWDSGCSYSVGVVFEHKRDAMMFKLRWR